MTIFIGVAGGSGSGKSTFCERLRQSLGTECNVISHDSYYRSQETRSTLNREQFNYDHPSALDTDLLCAHLRSLQQGHAVQVPVYSFADHDRMERTESVYPTRILIVEGILLFTEERVRSLFHHLIFVDASDATRCQRRTNRDVHERRRSLESVLQQWQHSVLPMHNKYVEPSKKWADVIVSTESNWADIPEVLKKLGVSRTVGFEPGN